mmetsp:Transcript_83008/g.231694  ORF Transcript_83008/g.231694 Transcript_83008/m.231694 type:complete len:252 (-) Transcript_83008:3792-4547(-)
MRSLARLVSAPLRQASASASSPRFSCAAASTAPVASSKRESAREAEAEAAARGATIPEALALTAPPWAPLAPAQRAEICRSVRATSTAVAAQLGPAHANSGAWPPGTLVTTPTVAARTSGKGDASGLRSSKHRSAIGRHRHSSHALNNRTPPRVRLSEEHPVPSELAVPSCRARRQNSRGSCTVRQRRLPWKLGPSAPRRHSSVERSTSPAAAQSSACGTDARAKQPSMHTRRPRCCAHAAASSSLAQSAV